MLRVNLERGSKLYQVFEGSPLESSLPVKDDPDLKGAGQTVTRGILFILSIAQRFSSSKTASRTMPPSHRGLEGILGSVQERWSHLPDTN